VLLFFLLLLFSLAPPPPPLHLGSKLLLLISFFLSFLYSPVVAADLGKISPRMARVWVAAD
jgi:hypothetical protein